MTSGCRVGTRLTPTPSVGSSLSCQLHAAGLHAAATANNSSSKRSSTNFSTSSDNAEDANCTSVDVGYVSAVDATHRQAPLSTVSDCSRQLLNQPPTSSIDDAIDTFPVGDRRRSGRSVEPRVDPFPTEVDTRTKPTADHVTRWTLNRDYSGPVLGTHCSAPRRWSCNANDVILSSMNQRDQVDRGVITSTPCV